MNTRIRDFENGYVEEIISDTVGLYWDLATNTGAAHFSMKMVASLNGEVRSITPAGTLVHAMDPLNPSVAQVPVVDIHGQPVLDAEGAVQYQEISDAQVMVIHKAFFDQLHNAKFTPPVVPEVPPEPAPETLP